jgi:hypothetical protein
LLLRKGVASGSAFLCVLFIGFLDSGLSAGATDSLQTKSESIPKVYCRIAQELVTTVHAIHSLGGQERSEVVDGHQ